MNKLEIDNFIDNSLKNDSMNLSNFYPTNKDISEILKIQEYLESKINLNKYKTKALFQIKDLSLFLDEINLKDMNFKTFNKVIDDCRIFILNKQFTENNRVIININNFPTLSGKKKILLYSNLSLSKYNSVISIEDYIQKDKITAYCLLIYSLNNEYIRKDVESVDLDELLKYCKLEYNKEPIASNIKNFILEFTTDKNIFRIKKLNISFEV